MPLSPYARLGQTTIAAPDQTARRHVVVGDETIQSIAQSEYPNLGYNAEAWRAIAEANDIDDLDEDVTAGVVLTVPAPPAPTT